MIGRKINDVLYEYVEEARATPLQGEVLLTVDASSQDKFLQFTG
jgi:hypothetical protein